MLSDGLTALHDVLNNQPCTYEILIVDDGSVMKDEIRAIAAQHNCGYLRNDPNAGKGNAVRKGVLAASGDCIIFMDGDFPFELQVIENMMLALQQHPIVIGDRTLPGSKYAKETVVLRKAGSRILSSIINRFYVKGITDSQCGIKGFHAKIAKAMFERITLNGFSFDVELLYIAQRNQIPVHRIPVHVFEQEGSSVNVFKDGLVMLFSLFQIKLNNARRKYTIDE
ncbi:glycosyltransferase [Pseudoflavitalea sp. G-6-1-2]|nr:glycosyltransferase [Pseudoflavitalea sp. G-6-1-2]